jgi:hypothetical protein
MSAPPEQGIGGRIDIRVPDSALSTDETVWEELEEYLFTGFLISSATIQNQHFIFKTLNQSELRLINFLKPPKSPKFLNSPEFKAAFIAYSVFYVNGRNAIFERPKHIDKLIKTFLKFPASLTDKIIENLSALNSKAMRLFPLVEPYSYESRSRYKWLQVRQSMINDQSISGIPGTNELGINQCQNAWVALNNILDNKEKVEADWANAKFIGGCFVGKGMRSVEDRDRSRLERERTEREELKMKVLKNYLNRVVGEEKYTEQISLPDGRTAEVVGRFRAETAEDLAKQLTSALNNEKDFHDIAVENHRRQMVQRSLEIEKERSELLRKTGYISTGPLGSSVINESEMNDRVKRMRQYMVDNFTQVTPAVDGDT